MLFIKKFLYKTLGLKLYLKLISRIFFLSYNYGLLREQREYFCHYFIKKLINKGDIIIDIGANLGYYSRIFASLTGKGGRVYAVEPVAIFREILQKNVKRYSNVKILPFALGKTNGVQISMGIPVHNKYLSHGRTHIVEKDEQNEFEKTFTAEMRNPQDLFKDLEKLDYIKCDVEGYEVVVISELLPLLKKFNPILQIETGGANRQKIIDLLVPLGYNIYYIDSEGAKTFDVENPPKFSGDLMFSRRDITM